MPAILEAQELGFKYGERTIFDRMAIHLQAGEMVALLGANGVGKTTLLNMFAGLLKPAQGRVLIDGREVGDWKRRELSRYVALVPQHLDVPFSFRVEEIVAQGRVPYLGRFGTLSAKDRAVVEDALNVVDVEKLRHRVYSELSGGEKQRVKIAIGLTQQAKIMLLDEPTQHLDIGRQIEVVSLLRRLNARGITMLAAIHDLGIVRDNFSRSILLMDEACISGATMEVMRPELLERAFSVEASALKSFCEGPLSAIGTNLQRDCRRTRPAKDRTARGTRLPRS